jgi:hypothetical protein
MGVMSAPALLFALLMTVNQTSNVQHLDASSEATLERTTAAAREELPESQRAKFDQAIKVLMADFIEKQGDGVAQDQIVADWRVALHGKTANEVLAAAEDIVRKMINDHATKRATAVRHPVPNAAAARGTSFGCESLLHTSIKPERPDEAEYFAVTETSLLKPDSEIDELIERRQLSAVAATGTDTLAIEIDGKNVKFITRASVEMGQASPSTFTITRNNESVLIAFAVDETLLGVTIDSLLLNRENGLAVWTKSRSASIMGDQPMTQSLYLRCR